MSQYVKVEVENCVRTTDKSALLTVEGDEFWVPFSQIEDNGEPLKEGFSGELYVARWVCEVKGIPCSEE